MSHSELVSESIAYAMSCRTNLDDSSFNVYQGFVHQLYYYLFLAYLI